MAEHFQHQRTYTLAKNTAKSPHLLCSSSLPNTHTSSFDFGQENENDRYENLTFGRTAKAIVGTGRSSGAQDSSLETDSCRARYTPGQLSLPNSTHLSPDLNEFRRSNSFLRVQSSSDIAFSDLLALSDRLRKTHRIKEGGFAISPKQSGRFVARKAVDWLLTTGEVETRVEAVRVLRLLQEYGLIRYSGIRRKVISDDSDVYVVRNTDNAEEYASTSSEASSADCSSVESKSPSPVTESSLSLRHDFLRASLGDQAHLIDKSSAVLHLLRSRNVTSPQYDLAFRLAEAVRLTLLKFSLTKNIRHRMKSHKKCFVAKEAVDWLIRQGLVETKEESLCIFSNFACCDFIHPVNEESAFAYEHQLFRFRVDDGTFVQAVTNEEMHSYAEIHDQLLKSSLLRTRTWQGKVYPCAIPGVLLVEWLMAYRQTPSRAATMEALQRMFKQRLLFHVGNKKDEFSDSETSLFQFSEAFQEPEIYMALPPCVQLHYTYKAREMSKFLARFGVDYRWSDYFMI